eukprot:scaffold3712_cov145-Skeletonema_marinoi.AAC.10
MTRSDRSRFIVNFCCIRTCNLEGVISLTYFHRRNALLAIIFYVEMILCWIGRLGVLVLSGEKEVEGSVVEKRTYYVRDRRLKTVRNGSSHRECGPTCRQPLLSSPHKPQASPVCFVFVWSLGIPGIPKYLFHE